jgi:hypothetical protein
MVSWYKNEIKRAGVSNCMHQCLNIFGAKRTHSHVPVLKGEAQVFSVSADRKLVGIRIVLICNTNSHTHKTVQIEIGLSEYGGNKKAVRTDGLLAKHQN